MAEQLNQSHFSMVLAATVHDIKNALAIISQQLQSLLVELDHQDLPQISVLQQEANRMNGMLVQLLTLYKHDNQQLAVNIGFHNVYDFLEEQYLSFDELLEQKNIAIIMAVDDELEWAFDLNLLSVLISNIISNTIRYANSEIRISAFEADNMLCIEIHDNGEGFPEQMLDEQNQAILGISSRSSKTGLGLYFAKLIANLHRNGDKMGNIKLTNTKTGGCFKINLP